MTSPELKARMDHTANIHNPTSYEYQADIDNRALQIQRNKESHREE